jgi:hypothetical protein
MIWASKDSFCPVGENFQKRKGKLVEISTRREKISHNIPNFLCGKNNKICPKNE